uniref:hypothetical protein n=1 Tax=Clostridium fessum TaxID=2126740 RepID=UPI0022E6E71A
MEKRKPNDLPPEQCLAVDTDTLCKLLCCGRHTAVQIGDLANARITMNTRVLWSVQRIKEYPDCRQSPAFAGFCYCWNRFS